MTHPPPSAIDLALRAAYQDKLADIADCLFQDLAVLVPARGELVPLLGRAVAHQLTKRTRRPLQFELVTLPLDPALGPADALYSACAVAIRKLRAKDRTPKRAVLALGHLELIAPAGSQPRYLETRARDLILELLDRRDATLLAFADPSADLPVGLRARFDQEIPVDAVGESGLLGLLTQRQLAALDRCGVTVGDLAARCAHLDLLTCRKLIAAACHQARTRAANRETVLGRLDRQVGRIPVVGESGVPAARSEQLSLADVAGLAAIKDRLSRNVIRPFQRARAAEPDARNLWRQVPGVLLHGPPGTGKTLLARSVAGELGVPFVLVKGPELFTMWLGESERKTRAAFQEARALALAHGGCVLFFDEIDAMVSNRNNDRSMTRSGRAVVNTFLSELGGADTTSGVLVIGATNTPELLDPAVTRPGRLGERILVGPPDAVSRRAILAMHAKRCGVVLAEDLADELVQLTTLPLPDGTRTTGAHLEQVCLWFERRRHDGAPAAPQSEDLHRALHEVLGLQPLRPDPVRDRRAAVHEAGHATVALACLGDVVERVVVREGPRAGYTTLHPEAAAAVEATHLRGLLLVAMGGRAAEALVFGDVGSSARDDLAKARSFALQLICELGTDQVVGPVYVPHPELASTPKGAHVAAVTLGLVDERVAAVVRQADAEAGALLARQADLFGAILAGLQERGRLEQADLRALLCPPPEPAAGPRPCQT